MALMPNAGILKGAREQKWPPSEFQDLIPVINNQLEPFVVVVFHCPLP
jgi:hypothetical protein